MPAAKIDQGGGKRAIVDRDVSTGELIRRITTNKPPTDAASLFRAVGDRP